MELAHLKLMNSLRDYPLAPFLGMFFERFLTRDHDLR